MVLMVIYVFGAGSSQTVKPVLTVAGHSESNYGR